MKKITVLFVLGVTTTVVLTAGGCASESEPDEIQTVFITDQQPDDQVVQPEDDQGNSDQDTDDQFYETLCASSEFDFGFLVGYQGSSGKRSFDEMEAGVDQYCPERAEEYDLDRAVVE